MVIFFFPFFVYPDFLLGLAMECGTCAFMKERAPCYGKPHRGVIANGAKGRGEFKESMQREKIMKRKRPKESLESESKKKKPQGELLEGERSSLSSFADEKSSGAKRNAELAQQLREQFEIAQQHIERLKAERNEWKAKSQATETKILESFKRRMECPICTCITFTPLRSKCCGKMICLEDAKKLTQTQLVEFAQNGCPQEWKDPKCPLCNGVNSTGKQGLLMECLVLDTSDDFYDIHVQELLKNPDQDLNEMDRKLFKELTCGYGCGKRFSPHISPSALARHADECCRTSLWDCPCCGKPEWNLTHRPFF